MLTRKKENIQNRYGYSNGGEELEVQTSLVEIKKDQD
jgi:hypothetical protein